MNGFQMNSKNIWFTSDLHLGHDNIIKFCNRPFHDVNEMNEKIISNWNEQVQEQDIVYHLGDFCFGNPKQYYPRLKGTIMFIPGSHDKNLNKNNLHILPPLCSLHFTMNSKDYNIVLCHYSMRSWDKSHYGTWQLFGHHHGKLAPYGLSFDVGVDTNKFYPYSLDDVERKMSTLKPIVDYRK
jgi:calcineurin-like phosphoesterase family protein